MIILATGALLTSSLSEPFLVGFRSVPNAAAGDKRMPRRAPQWIAEKMKAGRSDLSKKHCAHPHVYAEELWVDVPAQGRGLTAPRRHNIVVLPPRSISLTSIDDHVSATKMAFLTAGHVAASHFNDQWETGSRLLENSSLVEEAAVEPELRWRDMDKWHMECALLHAQSAASEGEVPVGAVLVASNGTVLARTHNRVQQASDPTAHAELIAVREVPCTLTGGGKRRATVATLDFHYLSCTELA